MQANWTEEEAGRVEAVFRRHSSFADAMAEVNATVRGCTASSINNAFKRRGKPAPSSMLVGATAPRGLAGAVPVGTSPQVQTFRVAATSHEATPAVEGRAYTGAPPCDFDDVAETRKTDPAPAESFREERILFIPDTHFPYEDKRAWQLMLRVGRFFQPHRIIVLGDMCDMYSTSFHDRSPSRVSRLADELAETARGLDDLDSLGAERKHLLQGNHEHRLVRTIAKVAPQLHGLRGLTLEEQLDLDARGWTHSKYMVEYHIGNLAICHDWGKCGLNALKQVVETLQRDVVQGHTHRAQTHCSVSRKTGETVRGDSFGWLGSFDELDYCHRAIAAEQWSHGCGVGWTQPDGGVRREVVRFIGGTAKIEGQAA